MKCPKCGKELTKDDLFRGFCPKCHSIIPDEIIKQQRRKELREEREAKEKAEKEKREKIEKIWSNNTMSEDFRKKEEEKESNKAKPKESNLVPCGDCGKLISPSAEACPYCGAPTLRGNIENLAVALHSLGCLFVLIALFFFFAALFASC